MNSCKNKTTLAIIAFASTAIIVAIGGCHKSNPIERSANTTNKSAVSKNTTPKTKEYKIFTRNKLQGVKDSRGKILIPAQYDEISLVKSYSDSPVKSDELDRFLLRNGYAIFTQRGKKGIVNLKGEVIISPQFDDLSSRFIDSKYTIASQNQRRGLLNLQTKKFKAFDDERIVDIRSSGSNVESGYLIAYNLDDEGVIDLQGNIIVPLAEYQTIEGYRDGVVLTRRKIIPGEFGDNFSEFNTNKPILPSRTNGKVEINKKTNSDNQDLFIDDVAVLMVESGNYFCGINRQGKLLFKARSDRWVEGEKIDNLCRSLVGISVDNNSVGRDSRQNYYKSFVRDGMIRIYVNGKYGYANTKGEIAIYPQFYRAKNFNEGLAKADRDYKWGLIDRTGEFVLAPQFNDISHFKEGLARVKIDDKYGYVDRTGKIVIKPQFDYAVDFNEGLARVKRNDKYGYVDRMGKIVIKPQFDYALSFSEGLATVRKKGIEFKIDTTGRIAFNFANLDRIYTLIKEWIAG